VSPLTPANLDRLEAASGPCRSLTRSAMGPPFWVQRPDRTVAAWATRCAADRTEKGEFLILIFDIRERGYAETATDVPADSAPSPSVAPRRWAYWPWRSARRNHRRTRSARGGELTA
jgi:hypothetical protein